MFEMHTKTQDIIRVKRTYDDKNTLITFDDHGKIASVILDLDEMKILHKHMRKMIWDMSIEKAIKDHEEQMKVMVNG